MPANRLDDAFTIAPTLDCNTIIAPIAARYACGSWKSSPTYRQTTAATPVLMACQRSPVLKRVKRPETTLTIVTSPSGVGSRSPPGVRLTCRMDRCQPFKSATESARMSQSPALLGHNASVTGTCCDAVCPAEADGPWRKASSPGGSGARIGSSPPNLGTSSAAHPRRAVPQGGLGQRGRHARG